MRAPKTVRAAGAFSRTRLSHSFFIRDFLYLPYSELQFFPKLGAFNIGWHESLRRTIYSFIPPRGFLTEPGFANHEADHSAFYPGFPELVLP